MVMRVDVVEKAIAFSKVKSQKLKVKSKERIILLDPRGKKFDQKKARILAKLDHLILVCGHYEGVDDRISHFVDEKISVGNYVLSGGEIPAMVITDSVVRLIPNVLAQNATDHESFGIERYLEEPQFTRPAVYKRLQVPRVLLSGDHQKIQKWKKLRRKSLE